jgi:beta-mannosidase
LDSIFFQQENIYLECPGLDTYASLYINGVLIGKTDNAFRNWNFDIKKNLQAGSNELIIKFQSTEEVANTLYTALETKLPGESRVMVRKPQYQFGWDFGPKLIGCGITQAISVHGWNSIKFYEASIHTMSIQDTFAELKLNARFFIQDTQAIYKIEIELGNQHFSFPVQSRYGMQDLKRFFTFDQPELWWPNEFGKPNLYATALHILKNDQIIFEKKWKTGIRTIELNHELDPKGQAFYFLVNGKKVFCKGSNYIPQDILNPNHSDHSHLIQTAVECHFNMLRIWGGGHYENDSFYAACDESGIMIWQDFMYACAMYPGDTAFLMNATLEAEQQVERLSKHACIALWCGNNENSEGWKRWGWQDDISTKNRERIWNDYLTLFDAILPEAVTKFSNKTDYWTTSPLFGRGDDRFTRNGDAHDWGLWHDEMPFEKLEKRIPRFMSEFGFQSWPSSQSIKQFSNELDPESKSLLKNIQEAIKSSMNILTEIILNLNHLMI